MQQGYDHEWSHQEIPKKKVMSYEDAINYLLHLTAYNPNSQIIQVRIIFNPFPMHHYKIFF